MQCQTNFAQSPWSDRLTLIPHSLHDATSLLEAERAPVFDCIVSNPPFYNATLKPEDEGRAIARHKDALPVEQIAAFAQQWLSDTGSLSLIYPTAYDPEVMTACILHRLQPSCLCDVFTKEGKPSKRRMATFTRQGGSHPPLACSQLAIRDKKGEYTKSYLTLVDPFYLHLA